MIVEIKGQIFELEEYKLLNIGDLLITPDQEVYEIVNIKSSIPSELVAIKSDLLIDNIPPDKKAVGVFPIVAA